MKTAFESIQEAIRSLYHDTESAEQKYSELREHFCESGASGEAYYFSAPGRIEICGNHTDHQKGSVLTASIENDITALASMNSDGMLRISSRGQTSFSVDVKDYAYRKTEIGKSSGMVRGIVSGFVRAGGRAGGADISIISDVPTGSGISSSAAFETLIASVINVFYNDSSFSPAEIAKIGQYAESRYFGKPCGLMDQYASAFGGCIGIDFSADKPIVEDTDMGCVTDRYDIFIVHCGGSHAKLGREYALIVEEMQAAARLMGKRFLSDVSEDDFMRSLPLIRSSCGDRSALRGMHFFAENARTKAAKEALYAGDTDAFLRLINESGDSSVLLLQNVYIDRLSDKSLALSLALTKKFLREKSSGGACRIHGGGFSGTTLSFIPRELSDEYRHYMDAVFGEGAAHAVYVRKYGARAVCKA